MDPENSFTNLAYTIIITAEFPNQFNANTSKLTYKVMYPKMGEDILEYAKGNDPMGDRVGKADDVVLNVVESIDNTFFHLYHKNNHINLKELATMDIYSLIDYMEEIGCYEYQIGTGSDRQEFDNKEEFLEAFNNQTEPLYFSNEKYSDIAIYYPLHPESIEDFDTIFLSPSVYGKKDEMETKITYDKLTVNKNNIDSLYKEFDFEELGFTKKVDEDDDYIDYELVYGGNSFKLIVRFEDDNIFDLIRIEKLY